LQPVFSPPANQQPSIARRHTQAVVAGDWQRPKSLILATAVKLEDVQKAAQVNEVLRL
jgi:hypothetical protein